MRKKKNYRYHNVFYTREKNMLRKIDKKLYHQIFVITLPIIIQNLLSAAVNSADVIMLNYVGQSALSAGALATQYSSVAFMIFFGIGTGVTMLCAQYWGKGDLSAIHKVEGIAMRFSLGISALFTMATLCFPEQLMRIFTNDSELIALGVTYLRIVSASFMLWSITEVYLAVLKSAGHVTISTIINGAALSTNVVLNAVFIFGLAGLPKMGIAGVALATTISRALALILCIIVSARSKDVKITLRTIFESHPELLKDFVTMSLPAVLNDVSWSVGFSMYSVILGHLGSDVVAANSIVSVVRNLGSVFCFAIGSASGIILGQILGENRIEDAKKAGNTLLFLSVVAGIAGGICVLIATPFIVDVAKLTSTAKEYLHFMLLINTYYITGGAVNTTLIAGVFRAGGDSRFGCICDTIDMWAYAVPLGFIAAFVFKLPVQVVYFLLCTDEFVKWPWVLKHYRSYKWARNITRDVIQ